MLGTIYDPTSCNSIGKTKEHTQTHMNATLKHWLSTLYHRPEPQSPVTLILPQEVPNEETAPRQTDVLFDPMPDILHTMQLQEELLERAQRAMSTFQRISSPRDFTSVRSSQSTKECPICKTPVGPPKQCYAAAEGSVTTCCVCHETHDMRSVAITLPCMHPVCSSCYDSMPV